MTNWRDKLHFSDDGPSLVAQMRALFPEQSTLRVRWPSYRWSKLVLTYDAKGRDLVSRAFTYHATRRRA